MGNSLINLFHVCTYSYYITFYVSINIVDRCIQKIILSVDRFLNHIRLNTFIFLMMYNHCTVFLDMLRLNDCLQRYRFLF